MTWVLLALVLLFPACASNTINPDVLREVPVPPGIAEQDRADCERQGVAAGAGAVSGPYRRNTSDDHLMWPYSEITVAADRDDAAISVYVRCLRKAAISAEAAQSKQSK